MTQADQPFRLRVASPADAADRAVLVRLADGELDALEELYDRYKTMAYSIAYRITNDTTLAEDVVQDAFLGAWRNAARYVEGRGSVKTWLLAIVQGALAELSHVQREAIELAYFGGLTQQEIADRTGTPLGTVKSRMRLGLLAMRRNLEGGSS